MYLYLSLCFFLPPSISILLLPSLNALSSFIETSIKQPICSSPVGAGQSVIVKETTQLKTSDLDLTIVSRATKSPSGSSLSPPAVTRKPRTVSVHFAEPLASSGPPVCDFVNVVQSSNEKKIKATLLLENPKGKSLPVAALGRQMAMVLGVDDAKKLSVGDVAEVDGVKVFTVTASSSSAASSNGLDKIHSSKKAKMSPAAESFCRYVNVCYMGGAEKNGQFPCATLLLENPVDSRRITADVIKTEVAKIFGVFNGKKLEFHLDVKKTQELGASEKIDDLHKRTIYVH